MKRYLLTLTFLLHFLAGALHSALALTMQPQTLTVNGHTVQLQVPAGMHVEFIAPLTAPRFLSLGPDGELLIGSSGPNIYRVRRPYTNPETLVSMPGRYHSVVYRNGSIYAAETAGLYSAPYPSSTAEILPGDFSLVTPLPSATGGHWSRTVIVGPAAKLYIGIGISGNCSDEYLDTSYPFERRRGGVYILDETSGTPALAPFSSGLRNPIGLAFQPASGTLFATNAGPDNLGFDLPPEILAPLSQGSFHGMPWLQFYNGAFRSGECAASPLPSSAPLPTPPSITFAARSTPQGIVFFDSPGLGAEFENNALIAIHGSWAIPPGGDISGRRPPKIIMVQFSGGNPVGTVDVVTGFQRPDGSRFARPSGMVVGGDGNLYFTSDAGEVTGLFRLAPLKITSANSVSAIIHLLLNKNGQV